MSAVEDNLPIRYLTDEWVVYADDDGDEYYYNLITTDTRWDNPLEDPSYVAAPNTMNKGEDGDEVCEEEELTMQLNAIDIDTNTDNPQEESQMLPPAPTTPPPKSIPVGITEVSADSASPPPPPPPPVSAVDRSQIVEEVIEQPPRQRSGSDVSDVTMSSFQPSISVTRPVTSAVVPAGARATTSVPKAQPGGNPFANDDEPQNPFADESADDGNPFSGDDKPDGNPFGDEPTKGPAILATNANVSLLEAAKKYKKISATTSQTQQKQGSSNLLAPGRRAAPMVPAKVPAPPARRNSAFQVLSAPQVGIAPSEPMSLCTIRLIQLGVKKNAAFMAQENGCNFVQALQHVNASIRDHVHMNPSIPSGLWAPRLEARIKSWLPNVPDPDNKEYHTGYVMVVTFFKVQDGGLVNWQLITRFSVLRDLHKIVSKYNKIAALTKKFPAHQSMGLMLSGVTDAVRDQRRTELDSWLQDLLSNEVLMTTPEIIDCLHTLVELEKHIEV